MTLVQTIENVVEWLRENVCSQISLKLPEDSQNGESYAVKYVNPAAFPLYVPGKERTPPSVPAPIPSVCVQLMEGYDDLLQRKRQIKIRLCLTCWNPGEHGDEVLHARPDANALGGYSYYSVNESNAQKYARNMEGWRDSFNFADLMLRELENAEYIANHRLVKESGIKFGLFTEDGNIYDYYPYWSNWISFTLEAGVTSRIPKAYENLL